MRKTTTIALAVILGGLAGCSTFDEKPVQTTNVAADTVVATPAPVAPAPTAIDEPTQVKVDGTFIDAAAILQKLDDIGCRLSELTLREVKRGGHFGVKCVINDPLNTAVEDL